MKRNLIIAAISLAFTTLAFGAATTEVNGVLRDNTGRTLYVFAKDEANKSKCANECAKIWPAFVAKEGAQPNGDLTLITREDGSGKQWVLKGKPLYYYVGDKAGETNGDGIGGTWSVIRTTPIPASSKAASSSSTGY